eukprot:TCONS_00048009-protein
MMADGFEVAPAADDSRLSDISFPSHVSGLGSFVDLEETIISEGEEDEGEDQVFKDEPKENHDIAKEKSTENQVANMKAFLAISSPPVTASNSNSMNSLNESSSMSLSRLEALQESLHDSFLNSHSDDSEREKNMQRFLQEAAYSSEKYDQEKPPSLSDMIDLSKKMKSFQMHSRDTTIAFDLNQTDQDVNQTELDSIFMKEVRKRLQLTNVDETINPSPLEEEIDKTVLNSDEDENNNAEDTQSDASAIAEKITEDLRKIDNMDMCKLYGEIERPHLDGSSSDSDTDVNLQPTSTSVQNFARTSIQTKRFELQHELEGLNLDNIPERQLAEGIDNDSETFNTNNDGGGGGGGDGSSGPEDEMGGDGGVLIRNRRLASQGVGSASNHSDDEDDDDRSTPPSRERPVGGSGNNNDGSGLRQVHFAASITNQMSTPTSLPLAAEPQNKVDTTPQDSRLSARYFLAASTPFKSDEPEDTMTNPPNWMNQTQSFHMGQGQSTPGGKSEERTLIGASRDEMTLMNTPSSMTLTRLKQQHGELPDWTFNQTDGNFTNKNITNPFEATDPPHYNPFDTYNAEGGNGAGFPAMSEAEFNGFNGSVRSEDFHGDKDLEALFEEDERQVALNHNSVYKEPNESAVSEWSLRTQNQHIPSMMLPTEAEEEDEQGRASVYFKAKSKDMGNLSGGNASTRPKFSDDKSHKVVTPPTAQPIGLIHKGRSSETDQTIPPNVSDSIFEEDTPVQSNATYVQSEAVETPKSALLKTHKRMSNTVLLKKKKRQLVGQEAETSVAATSEEKVSSAPAVSIPSSELEASCLLDDIKERRVSTIGLDDSQVMNLAKLISTMTGTEEDMVYQLICLLPKKNDVIKRISNQSKKMSNTSNSKSFHSSMTSNNSLKTLSTSSERTIKPISSVIPLNAERSQYSEPSRDSHTINYMQSTHLPERYSDPQPLFERPATEQRLAVSVSPVRNNALQNNRTAPTPYGHFQPTSLQTSDRSFLGTLTDNRSFVPLAAHTRTLTEGISRTSGDFSSTYSHTTAASSFGSISKHDSLIHSESIVYPRDVNFDICCSGASSQRIIQIKNTNKCWMQVQLQVAFFAFNGREMDHRCNETFIMPPKVTLEPQSEEDVKLKFLPSHPGTFMLKIELLVTSLIQNEMNLRWQRLPVVMNLDGISETADIELLFREERFLDFGEMCYGSVCQQELTVLNKGRAEVPLQLYVENTPTGTNGPLFLLHSNEQDMKATKLCTTIQGRNEHSSSIKPKTIIITFNAPSSTFRAIDEKTMSPPDEFSNQLRVVTNTKNPKEIGNIFMKAIVGISRLHSLKTMQAITFNSTVGQTVSRIIPLRNAGNISLKLEPKIIGASAQFTVHPTSLKIKPGGESEIKVSFSSGFAVTSESRLLVTLLPDGHQYEWSLRGTCINAQPTLNKPILLCNKLSLDWSGVALLTKKQQRIVLKNNSNSKSIDLSVCISDSHPNFQIHPNTSLQERSINKYETTLKPSAELPIHISYSPTSLSMDKSSLVLRTTNGATKYVIPLSGYGGCSNLDISGAKVVNGEFVVDLGHLSIGQKRTVTLMLRNSGMRASFVALKCFSDITARIEYPSTHVTISPNNFVLMEKTSCQITLTYQPLKEHALKAQRGSFTPAQLVIFSGDEVLRREYRKYRRRTTNIQKSKTLKNLSITSDFLNESHVTEDIKYNDIADWEDFFLTSLKRNVVAMVTKPVIATQSFDKNVVKDEELVHILPNVSNRRKNSFEEFKSQTELWTVSPSSLNIDLSSTSDASTSQCRLKIINYSNKELPFECSCPTGDGFVITPSKDRIPPHGQLGVRVDPKRSFLSKLNKTEWMGQLSITCGNERKTVQFDIRNIPCHKATPIPSKDIEGRCSVEYDKSTTKDMPEWEVYPKEVELDSSLPSTECRLKITNNTNKPLPFEFIWPAETLVITPSKDKVPPFETLGVRIDARHTFLAKHEEDFWAGCVYVQCGCEQKKVKINMKNLKKRISKTNGLKKNATRSPPLLNPSHDLSLEPHQHPSSTKKASAKESCSISPHTMEFDATPCNTNQDSIFTISNSSMKDIQWSVQPVGPTYFKSIEADAQITSTKSKIFQFLNSNGIVGAQQITKLPIMFKPTQAGIYSQFWDFEVSHGNGRREKTRIELTGKGKSVDISTSKMPPKTLQTSVAAMVTSDRLGNIFLKDDVVEFPATKVGKTKEMKFRLCNDGTEVTRIRLSGFHSPFSVVEKHTKLFLKPKSYIRVPVTFTPTVANSSFTGLIIVSLDNQQQNGGNICVQLSGTSSF